MRPITTLLTASAALCMALTAGLAQAQDYPNRPLRLIIPYAAGGPTDLQGRIYADRLNDGLHQSVVVENRPGAGEMLGAEVVAHSAPDGYTILLCSATIVYAPHLMSVPIDPLKELTPVAQVSFVPLTMFINTRIPVHNFAELLAYARANPGKLNLGVSAYGAADHMGVELLNSRAGVKLITAVPYKGAVPIIQDLAADRVDMIITTLSAVRVHVDSGKVIPIAGVQSRRSPFLPDVATIGESGFPGYDIPTWNGIFGPAGMPAAAVARLGSELQQTVQNPEVVAKVRGLSIVPTYANAADLAVTMRDSSERIGKIVRDAGLRPQ